MTTSNISPVTGSLVLHGDSFSFDLDDAGTTPSVIQVSVEGSATEVAWTLAGGFQSGFTGTAVKVGNVYTITVSRTAGWNASPFTVNVDWTIGGIPSTSSWSYELAVEQQYPTGMTPRNPIAQGTLIVTESDVARLTDAGWIDFVGATVTNLGNGKVRINVTGGGGSSTFAGLSDTPANYTNTRGGVPQVNDAEAALEFTYGLPDFGQWLYLAPPSAVPLAGQICTNATILANINAIHVHNDNWGGDTMRSALLEVEVGTKLYLRDEQLGEGGVYAVDAVTDNTTYVTFTVTAQTVDAGPFGASGSTMALTVLPGAAAAAAGGSYGYGTWTYDAGATTGSGISAGNFRLNNADPTSASILYIRKDNREGVNLGTILEDAGGYRLSFWNVDGTEGFVCDLSGSPSDLSAYWQFSISNVVGDISLVDGATFGVTYMAPSVSPAGDVSGPASAADGAVALFDGTTGKLLKDDGTLSVDGFGNLIATQEIQAAGELQSDTGTTVKEVASHTTPATGYVSVYAKTDKKLYIKDDAGTETDLTSGGAGGAFTEYTIALGTASPASGEIGTITSAGSGWNALTTLHINDTDADGLNMSEWLFRLQAGDLLVLRESAARGDGTTFFVSTLTDNTTHWTITGTPFNSSGLISDTAKLSIYPVERDRTAIHDNASGEIAALPLVTAASGDHILIEDASDSNSKKRVAASDFLGGGGSAAAISPIGTFVYDSSLVFADPGAGNFRLTNADPALSANITFGEDNANGNNISPILSSFRLGDKVYCQQTDDPTVAFLLSVRSSATIGTFITLAIDTTLADSTVTSITNGKVFAFTKLESPYSVSGLGTWVAAAATTPAATSAGNIKFNNTNPTSATEMYLHKQNNQGFLVGTALSELGGGRVSVCRSDGTRFISMKVDSVAESGVFNVLTLSISDVVGSTSFAALEELVLDFVGSSSSGGSSTFSGLPFMVTFSAAPDTTNYYGPNQSSGSSGYPSFQSFVTSWGPGPLTYPYTLAPTVPVACTLDNAHFSIRPNAANLVQDFDIVKISYSTDPTGATTSVVHSFEYGGALGSSAAHSSANAYLYAATPGVSFGAGDGYMLLAKNVSGALPCFVRCSLLFTQV